MCRASSKNVPLLTGEGLLVVLYRNAIELNLGMNPTHLMLVIIYYEKSPNCIH